MSNVSDSEKSLFDEPYLTDGFGLFGDSQIGATTAFRTPMVGYYIHNPWSEEYSEEEMVRAALEAEEINKRRCEGYKKLTEIEKTYSRDSVQYSEQREVLMQCHLELVEKFKIFRSNVKTAMLATLPLTYAKENGISARTFQMIANDLTNRVVGTHAQLYYLYRVLHERELVSICDEEIPKIGKTELKDKLIEKKNLTLFAVPEVEGWYFGIDFLDCKSLLTSKSDYEARLMMLTYTKGDSFKDKMEKISREAGVAFANRYVDSTNLDDSEEEYFSSLVFGAYLKIADEYNEARFVEFARGNVSRESYESLGKAVEVAKLDKCFHVDIW